MRIDGGNPTALGPQLDPQAIARTQEISRVFQALADPTRRAVLERLAQGPASTSELAEPFDMALPSFAQHLAVLEQCGLVHSHKKGRVRHFHLEPTALACAGDWVAEQRALWGQRLDRLEDYVSRTTPSD
ncbi:MAG: metalloregulator ArsR/SmtB family transcription factor [Acidovorax sp.]|jgi:DNA-binding transcriptional ArsR family regulator|nr:metalloregulator ArsR/SmtB family transcription factor [Acidovorax sp.]MDR3005053.1 metalloregulator ArsR/SmtB family transcription factor [Acidovorax sp.]